MDNHDPELRKMGEAFEEVSRQLAAANERAEKLEAQMVELRELWEIIDSGVKPKPHCEDEVGGAALAIKRILGGV